MKNKIYHGTGNLDSIKEKGFIKEFTGMGNNSIGSGYYFTDSEKEAGKVYTNCQIGHEDNKVGGSDSPGVVTVNVELKKPIHLPENSYGIQDCDIEISPEDAFKILSSSNLLKTLPSDTKKTNPLVDYFDDFSETGPTDDMIYSLAESSCDSIIDLYSFFDKDELYKINEGIHETLGYDGVVLPFDNGVTHYVAWFSEQVEIIDFEYKNKKEPKDDFSYIVASSDNSSISFRVNSEKLSSNKNLAKQKLHDFIGDEYKSYDTYNIYPDQKSFLKNNHSISINDLKEIDSGRNIKKYDNYYENQFSF